MPQRKDRHELPAPDYGVQNQNLRTKADIMENRLIRMLDTKRTLEKYDKLFTRMAEGSADAPAVFKEMANDAILVVGDLMLHSTNEKIQLEAAKDVLDRAGYNKTNKLAIAHATISHETSRAELINIIMTSMRRVGKSMRGPHFNCTEAAADMLPAETPRNFDLGRPNHNPEPKVFDVESEPVDEEPDEL